MAGGNIVQITTGEEFQSKVIDSKELVVVDFYADWCGPCKQIAPKVADFSNTYKNVKFYKVDVDAEVESLQRVAGELGIRAMPTFLLFKDGEQVADVVGANPPALENAIKQLSASA